MTTITEILLHGHVNHTHTSTQTPYYLSRDLPTPWPLLVTGVLVSLIISCYGVKAAFLSLNATTDSSKRPKSPWTRKKNIHQIHVHETELERLHVSNVADLPPPYSSHRTSSSLETPQQERVAEPSPELDPPPFPTLQISTWTESTSPTKRFIDVFIILYSSFRAIVAIIIALGTLISTHISPSAPSNLLLLLVSIQILLSNLLYPRLLRGLLTLDVLLAALSFTITSYSSLSSSHAKYGDISFTGGTCPIIASNCIQQSKHWTTVGCGNYTELIDYEDSDDDAKPSGDFYAPYATSGTWNIKLNPLTVIETIIWVFGTIWLLTVLFQLYEVRYIISPRPPRSRQMKRGRCSNSLFGCITLLGVLGAIVAAAMSVGGHMSQALGIHKAVFMDSFGPEVKTNVTMGTVTGHAGSVVLGSDYWGNATSWTDCFVMEAPRSGNGWWDDWRKWNSGVIFRVAAGL